MSAWRGFPFSAAADGDAEETTDAAVCSTEESNVISHPNQKRSKQQSEKKVAKRSKPETPIKPASVASPPSPRNSPSKSASDWTWEVEKLVRGHAGESIPVSTRDDGSARKVINPQHAWMIVSLEAGEQLLCIGSARICCLEGRLDAYGLILDGRDVAAGDDRGTFVTVHAPAWHGAITIRALDSMAMNKRKQSLERVTTRVLMVATADSVASGKASAAVEGGHDGGGRHLAWSMGAFVDGEEARRVQSKKLFKVDESPDLGLPGWCVLFAPEPRMALDYPVIRVPASWTSGADDMVEEHNRQLERCMTRSKLQIVRRRRALVRSTTAPSSDRPLAAAVGSPRDGRERGATDNNGMRSSPSSITTTTDDADGERSLVALVCGAKGVGKSGFTRYLVNRLVSARRDWLRRYLLDSDDHQSNGRSAGAMECGEDGEEAEATDSKTASDAGLLWRNARLMMLELDVGQPEMTPSGQVALHAIGGQLAAIDYSLASVSEVDRCAALLGPPHSHLHTPLCAYFLGEVSSKRAPGRYLQSISQLATVFRSLAGRKKNPSSDGLHSGVAGTEESAASLACECLSGTSTPLVVNCDGWVKGLGLELLAGAINILKPTTIFQLQGEVRSKQFALPTRVPEGAGGESESGCYLYDTYHARLDVRDLGSWDALETHDTRSLLATGNIGGSPTGTGDPRTDGESKASSLTPGHSLSSSSSSSSSVAGLGVVAKSATTVSPSDQRTVRIAAYFGRAFLYSGAPLGAVNAFVRNGALADSEGSLAAFLASLSPYRISTTAVRLQTMDERDFPNPTERLHAFNGSLVALVHQPHDNSMLLQSTFSPHSPPLPECLGLGIVRSIDCAAQQLYLITPVDRRTLARCNALISPPSGSGIALPTQLLYTSLTGSCPYLFCESAGSATVAMKSRNNLLRRSGGGGGDER